jgi:hypothetical protein
MAPSTCEYQCGEFAGTMITSPFETFLRDAVDDRCRLAVGAAHDLSAGDDSARSFDDVMQLGVAFMRDRAGRLRAMHDVDAVLIGVRHRGRRHAAGGCFGDLQRGRQRFRGLVRCW